MKRVDLDGPAKLTPRWFAVYLAAIVILIVVGVYFLARYGLPLNPAI